MGPSSIHPNESVYIIINDAPITVISPELMKTITVRFKTSPAILEEMIVKVEEAVTKAKTLSIVIYY